MTFGLIDEVVELQEDRIVALKRVRDDEWYLGDHFPTFPVLPGVLMIESLVQAARLLVEHRAAARGEEGGRRWVLGGVRALKFGSFVRPGETLLVEVTHAGEEDGAVQFKGVGKRLGPGEPASLAPTTVSGRFSLRPMRLHTSPARVT